MLKRFRGHRAVSSLEFMAIIAFIVVALLVFQRYIFRAIAGGWKAAGDTFGHGRQYDPRPYDEEGKGRGSKECFFDYTHCKPGRQAQYPCENVADRIYTWIDKRCVEINRCDCTIQPLVGWGEYNSKCLQCYANCRSAECGSDVSW